MVLQTLKKVLAAVILSCCNGCNAEPAVPAPSALCGVLYINEFMASNSRTVRDEAGDYDDWGELFNAGDRPVNLRGAFLTDNLSVPMKWSFPDTVIPAGGFLLIWADGEYREGPLHTSFKLDAGNGEQLGLFVTDGDHLFRVDTLSFGPQSQDVSCGRIPDGGGWRYLTVPTPGRANCSGVSPLQGRLFLNEFMASNQSIVADEAGEFDDWIEIYNADSLPIRLTGIYLTDDLRVPDKWPFPDTCIRPHSYMLIWADTEASEGPLHASFNLAAARGEQLGLYESMSGHALVIDSLTFGPQHPDTSYGRYPDAGSEWQFMPSPSPRAPNRSGKGR
ncbi:MAG: lamin tail domain-containing protein [candidate division WOR-3 bacterium]